jgi:hypothetical protein
MHIGVQNITTVSTSYEQKEKALFNYTHYKYKTKIGRGKRANIRKWTGLWRIYITNEPEIMFL